MVHLCASAAYLGQIVVAMANLLPLSKRLLAYRHMEMQSLTRIPCSLFPTTIVQYFSRGASLSTARSSGLLSPSGGTGNTNRLAHAGSDSSVQLMRCKTSSPGCCGWWYLGLLTAISCVKSKSWMHPCQPREVFAQGHSQQSGSWPQALMGKAISHLANQQEMVQV